MKISDLITKLQKLEQHLGDANLYFSAIDDFSRYGEAMELNLHVGDSSDFPSAFGGFSGDGNGNVTLKFDLKQKGGKRPKITFR